MRRCLGVAAVAFLLFNPMTSWAQEFCREASTVIADFTPYTLSLPVGTVITDQFAKQGIVFSTDGADLPPEYQKSLGPQEHVVREGGATYPFDQNVDAILTNLFRIDFTRRNVVSVSVTLRDKNLNPQVHTLTAFDSSGNVLDVDSLTESGELIDRFTLTVSSCAGIVSIVALEQPFGAEQVDRVTFTLGRADKRNARNGHEVKGRHTEHH